ncbi:MAG: lysyl-tRNA synthetase class 2 [Candidatus Azotimanducaceae bacterium]|jgi:lysyl-tRNA synthetase class 2
MSSHEELRAERLRKKDMLVAAGMNPYASDTGRTHTIEQVLTGFETLSDDETELSISGRVMAMRRHGGSAFIDLFDGTARMQVFLSKDAIGMRMFDLLNDTIDPSDFIEVKGVPFLTKRGTEAVAVSDWRVLTKSLQAIPTEHFGIKDEDERYRKRYLDILLDQDLQTLFTQKAKFWKASREFMETEGFLEVHTPTLETTTGGAEANPFITKHNDFDIEVYLRISVGELWQKRLMASGLPKVYEIGRVYRNEGTSPDHLQEFTNLEFYAAFMNFDEGLDLLERHIQHVLEHAFDGKKQFTIKEYEVDFSKPFPRIDYLETIKKETGCDPTTATEVEIAATLAQLGVTYEGNNRERLTDTLWKYCRKKIAGPVWLTGHPKLVSPLSKENEEMKGTVLRGQLIMAGAEFNNCYAELNDPVEQTNRFKVQEDLIKGGDSEAMMPDWEFVEMLEHGMPPTFGAASLGERFFAYLVDKPIRETQLFPLMKPKAPTGKSKVRKSAVAVLNTGAGLEAWQKLNTIAHLTAELGAREGSSLLKYDSVSTKDDQQIPLNIQHAIMVKEAQSGAELLALLTTARNQGLSVAAFTREMLETTNDNKVKEATAEKNIDDIEFLGVLVFGDSESVNTATANFTLSE